MSLEAYFMVYILGFLAVIYSGLVISYAVDKIKNIFKRKQKR